MSNNQRKYNEKEKEERQKEKKRQKRTMAWRVRDNNKRHNGDNAGGHMAW